MISKISLLPDTESDVFRKGLSDIVVGIENYERLAKYQKLSNSLCYASFILLIGHFALGLFPALFITSLFCILIHLVIEIYLSYKGWKSPLLRDIVNLSMSRFYKIKSPHKAEIMSSLKDGSIFKKIEEGSIWSYQEISFIAHLGKTVEGDKVAFAIKILFAKFQVTAQGHTGYSLRKCSEEITKDPMSVFQYSGMISKSLLYQLSHMRDDLPQKESDKYGQLTFQQMIDKLLTDHT